MLGDNLNMESTRKKPQLPLRETPLVEREKVRPWFPVLTAKKYINLKASTCNFSFRPLCNKFATSASVKRGEHVLTEQQHCDR